MTIQFYSDWAVTLLADGTVCRWNTEPTESMVPDLINMGAGVVEKICTTANHDALYALTECGRIIEKSDSIPMYADITNLVNKELGSQTEDTIVVASYPVFNLSRGYPYILIARGNKVMRLRTSGCCAMRAYTRTFESEIEMINRGDTDLVKTRDGHLYSLYGNGIGVSVMSALNFDHIENICKIVTGCDLKVIILNDGTVYAHGRYHNSPYQVGSAFSLVTLPQSEYVLDVIVRETYVFYITASGVCYHTRMSRYRSDPGYREPVGLKPELVCFLSSYSIENVFMLNNGAIVFQHDGGRLCLVHAGSHAGVICKEYYTGSIKPTRLDFFDDKGVVSVTLYQDYIYFTTQSGQVYYCKYNSDSRAFKSGCTTDRGPKGLDQENMDGSQIREIAFFRDNPIKVEGVCRTRSGGMMAACHRSRMMPTPLVTEEEESAGSNSRPDQ